MIIVDYFFFKSIRIEQLKQCALINNAIVLSLPEVIIRQLFYVLSLSESGVFYFEFESFFIVKFILGYQRTDGKTVGFQ